MGELATRVPYADRLDAILKVRGRWGSLVNSRQSVRELQVGGQHSSLIVAYHPERNGSSPVISEVPAYFYFPAYVLEDHGETMVQLSTPYGPMPRYVIGDNNELYRFSHDYLFNKQGEALKREATYWWSEEFTKESLPLADVIALSGFQGVPIPRVNFTPNCDFARYTNMDDVDDARVAAILGLLESRDL